MPEYTEYGDRAEAQLAHKPISWSAIFAGLFITLIVYVALMSLGLIFGGHSLSNYIQNPNDVRGLGFGATLWTLFSTVVALYAGGHMSGRIAGLITTRVGQMQGLVIASLFFVIMMTQFGIMIGLLGGGINSALSSLGSTTVNSTVGREIVEDAIGDLNLKAPVTEVVAGFGSRLMRGDENSAVTYLAQKAGISAEEARARMETFKARFNTTLEEAGQMAAKALRTAGWTLFFSILLGSAAAVAGGGLAANYNLRMPLSKADNMALRHARTHST